MVLLVNLARVIFAPLLREFIAVFGIDEGTAGLIATLVWLGSALLRLPIGWVLTKVPRHHVILATGGTLTSAAAFVASATSVVMVGGVFLTAVIGYVIHSLFPAIDTYLLDALPDNSRVSAYAWYSAGMMTVQATGSSAVGALRETGLAYDAIFGQLGAGLFVVVAGLALLQRRGRLPQ